MTIHLYRRLLVIDFSLMGRDQHKEKMVKKKPIKSKAEKRAEKLEKRRGKK